MITLKELKVVKPKNLSSKDLVKEISLDLKLSASYGRKKNNY